MHSEIRLVIIIYNNFIIRKHSNTFAMYIFIRFRVEKIEELDSNNMFPFELLFPFY